ncbi:MAG: HAMP domain-containing histidine kinase [Clostridia bacterium]|nr:HAMP domain-containing histidine kinase [Clostridia bacterium]
MFKKLRNSYLITNSIIIAALLALCFGAVYIMVYRNVTSNTAHRLEREIAMCEGQDSRNNQANQRPQEDKTPPAPIDDEKREQEIGGMFLDEATAFMPAFSIKCDANGNITAVNMGFNTEEDFYSELVPDLIASDTEKGTIHSATSEGESNTWQYQIKKTADSYIIAFVEVSRENSFLKGLLLVLILTMIIATFGAVMISWLFANRSIKPIEEAYNKQKQFIADASHELKTPLAAINTNLDVLMSHADSTIAEERKWLIYIKDETKRMIKLTQDLLYLTRTENTQDNTVYSKISWTQIANNAVMLMEARAFENGQTITQDISDGIFVTASDDKLKQLCLILVDNAIKYTPNGENIIITLNKKGNDAVFTVKNTGIGIKDDDIAHLFDRFYRADKSRTNDKTFGYGLGLPIAKAITKSLDGHISVSSKENEYTEFKVKLPLAK